MHLRKEQRYSVGKEIDPSHSNPHGLIVLESVRSTNQNNE